MPITLARYSKSAGKSRALPLMPDLIKCLAGVDCRPEIVEYLGERPELRSSLEGIVESIKQDAQSG